MAEKPKPEEKALVTAGELEQIREKLRAEIYECEVEPLKQRLLIAIEAVQSKAIAPVAFTPPTKEQVMSWIAPGCKDEQTISLFLATCKHLRLDPVKREIYLYEQKKGSGDWIIKVDYKVPIAMAHFDPDFLKIETGIEYLPAEKRPATTDRQNPWNIDYAWCRLHKRSAVRLAKELGDPTLGYEEYRAHWNVWRRLKGDGTLFSTWRDRGPFYIEKTAIDHLLRRCYRQVAQLPPSTGYEIIEEEGLTPEAKLLQDVKAEQRNNEKPEIDPDFSEAPAEESGQPELGLGGKQNFTPAQPEQISAIQSLLKIAKKKKRNADAVASAENALADHEAAVGAGEKGMSKEYAGSLISELQAA